MKPEEIPSDLAQRIASSAGISEHAARNALASVADAFVTEGWHRGINDAMDAFETEDQRLQLAMRCPKCGRHGSHSKYGGFWHVNMNSDDGNGHLYITWPGPVRRSSMDLLRDLIAGAAGGLPGA